MSGFFFDLGKRMAPTVLKTRWIHQSLAGSESEKIRAEHGMGRYLAYVHLQEVKVCPDPELGTWLNSLTKKLENCLTNRERQFQVRCILSPEANAFALPGGFIFISHALLELCQFDKDEIAFVLAHEMAHVVKSHSVNRILTSEVIQLLSRRALAGGALRHVLGGVIGKLLATGYSRDQELEADKFAARMVRLAGFAPDASLRLFDRLEKHGKAPAGVLGYFSSHPPFPLRTSRIHRVLKESEGS